MLWGLLACSAVVSLLLLSNMEHHEAPVAHPATHPETQRSVPDALLSSLPRGVREKFVDDSEAYMQRTLSDDLPLEKAMSNFELGAAKRFRERVRTGSDKKIPRVLTRDEVMKVMYSQQGKDKYLRTMSEKCVDSNPGLPGSKIILYGCHAKGMCVCSLYSSLLRSLYSSLLRSWSSSLLQAAPTRPLPTPPRG
jgi:hypothetical protein